MNFYHGASAQDPDGASGPDTWGTTTISSPSRPARGAAFRANTRFSPSPSRLGPHRPRCPPFRRQPRRQTRALNLPRTRPETTGRSSSPPSSSHSLRGPHSPDCGEATSVRRGDFFRVLGEPAPVRDREPIKAAVSEPGPALPQSTR